ncbi:unnamed protein product [Paramecium octaurelia]|uniref:Uncharacterized protein n=1 Tax=Paramecium octaurelia TaxID=43137 RepID=A0A8S1UHC4_PAROT|nr:unnamed protein product [Paramecium octaurelia]
MNFQPKGTIINYPNLLDCILQTNRIKENTNLDYLNLNQKDYYKQYFYFMLNYTKDCFSNFSEKRVKERSVEDALYRVREWRRIYESGQQKGSNKESRITLQEAAKQVKIPKKTLEDYIQIFNKVSLIAQIQDFSNKKMGFLRTFIRKNKAKIRKAAQAIRQNQRDCLDVKIEESLPHYLKNQLENSMTYEIKEGNLKNDFNFDIKIEKQEEE